MSGRRGGRNIAYTKQDEPAFIRQFKERVGYKEEPGIEEKVFVILQCCFSTALA